MSVGESMTIGQVLPSLPSYSLLAQETDKQTKNPSLHVGLTWVILELHGYQVGMGLKSESYLGLTWVN